MPPIARCLVADDDPDLLEVVARVIEGLGAEVVRARDGNELLDGLAHGGDFDVVVTDVSMPWMTGPQALHFAQTAGHRTRVIVITASREPWIPDQVRALGDDAHLLQKPFSRDQLCALLEAKLGAATAERARVPA